MSTRETPHGSTLNAESIADELIAGRNRDSEDFERSSYTGTRSRRALVGKKYRGHVYTKVGGSTLRKLSPADIDEFRAHVQRCIDPSLRMVPAFRKAVV